MYCKKLKSPLEVTIAQKKDYFPFGVLRFDPLIYLFSNLVIRHCNSVDFGVANCCVRL
jgi:hypothetical protein